MPTRRPSIPRKYSRTWRRSIRTRWPARDYALLLTALVTGRRAAEIAGMRWGLFKRIPDGRLVVHFPRCKGGKQMDDLLPAVASSATLTWLGRIYGELERIQPDVPIYTAPQVNHSSGARYAECGAPPAGLRERPTGARVRVPSTRKQSWPKARRPMLAWLDARHEAREHDG